MRLRTGVIAIIVIIVFGASGWAMSRTSGDERGHLAQALDAVPADTRVAGFTDWSRIRTATGVDRVRGDESPAALTDAAFERGLTARSILSGFATAMHGAFGWTVADLEWELYGQAASGSVIAVGMGSGMDPVRVERALAKIGYVERAGIWSVDPTTLSAIDPELPGSLTHVAVLGPDRLLYFSGSAHYLRSVVDLRHDRGGTLAGVIAAAQAAGPLRGAASAYIAVGKDECMASGFADRDETVRTQARNLVRRFGSLATYRYAGRGVFDDGHTSRLTFAMVFDSGAEAGAQAAVRRQLTTGPFIGRTGQMEDILTLDAAHVDGPTVALDFDFHAERAAFLQGNGGVLFAACSA